MGVFIQSQLQHEHLHNLELSLSWLHVHIRDTRNSVWLDGQVQPGERTTRFERIDVAPLIVSAAASAAIAGIFSLPFLFEVRDKTEPATRDTKST
jgi:hypothetical protein